MSVSRDVRFCEPGKMEELNAFYDHRAQDICSGGKQNEKIIINPERRKVVQESGCSALFAFYNLMAFFQLEHFLLF